MDRLAHIVAVKSQPPEIEETVVPVHKEAERISRFSKRFDTVFTLRYFRGSAPSKWGVQEGRP